MQLYFVLCTMGPQCEDDCCRLCNFFFLFFVEKKRKRNRVLKFAKMLIYVWDNAWTLISRSFLCSVDIVTREFTKPQRRRRGQRRLKNEFVFYLRISRYSKVINFVYHYQNYRKNKSGTRSPDDTEFGHFTSSFEEDDTEMYQQL